MTRKQRIRIAILGLCARRPAGYGYPEDALKAEVIMFVDDPHEVLPVEVCNNIEELVDEGYLYRQTNPVLGSNIYEITAEGKKYAPKF